MEQSALAEVGLPLAVFVMMVTLGLTLSWADFKRLVTSPRAVVVGLCLQLLALPLLGFLLAFALPLDPVIAVSVVLLAVMPGGATSNVIVYVTGGDRALSVTLTALSSSVTWLTVPLVMSWALGAFDVGAGDVDLPFFRTMFEVAAITVVPVGVGMAVRWRRPTFAAESQAAGKILSAAVLAIIVGALLVENWDLVVEDGPQYLPALVLFNGVALAGGYAIATWAGLARMQAGTVAIEAGIQNVALAITVALVSLDVAEISVIPALYGLWMLIAGFGAAVVLFRYQDRGEPVRLG